jgi:hypothetical protein
LRVTSRNKPSIFEEEVTEGKANVEKTEWNSESEENED